MTNQSIALNRPDAPVGGRAPAGQWRMVGRALRRDKLALLGAGVVAAAVLIALLGPLLAPHDPYRVNAGLRLRPPGTPGHLLGTDELGRDILSRLMYGARVSLPIAFLPVVISSLLGTLLGLVAGYFGKGLDTGIMRVLDVLFAFPPILLAIAIVAALGPNMINAVLAITVVSVPVFARLARASTLSLREIGYVEAARSAGSSDARIIARHILPNIIAPVIVYATLETGRLVIFAAGLSFLGLGVRPPTADWGGMLASGRDVLARAPHVATIPGLVILVVTLALNVLGDGLRDALDPRLRT